MRDLGQSSPLHTNNLLVVYKTSFRKIWLQVALAHELLDYDSWLAWPTVYSYEFSFLTQHFYVVQHGIISMFHSSQVS